MFQDLDNTLNQLLAAGNSPVKDAFVLFRTPDQSFTLTDGGNSFLNLYLYETRENRELRDPVPRIEKVGNEYRRRRPPVRIDCSYMVTAWIKLQPNEDEVLQEHRLLAEALRWFSQFPVIPQRLNGVEILQGSLRNAALPHPTLVAQAENGKNLGEFWTSLSRSPRPSFNLVVTVALDLNADQVEGPPVVSKGMGDTVYDPEAGLAVPGTESKNFWQIGGTIRAARPDPNPLALPPFPIARAKVRMPDLGLSTESDANGQFTFRLKRRGTFDVDIQADGFAPLQQRVSVPSESTDLHNIQLALDFSTLTGSVTELGSAPPSPIGNATVRLLHRRLLPLPAPSTPPTPSTPRLIGQTNSNPSGQFEFDISNSVQHADELLLEFEANGYESTQLEITIPDTKSNAYSVKLKKN